MERERERELFLGLILNFEGVGSDRQEIASTHFCVALADWVVAVVLFSRFWSCFNFIHQ